MLEKRTRIFFAIFILILLGLTGCGTRSLVVRGTRTNLLNKSNVVAPISNARKNVTIEITKWGPEYKIIIGYNSPTYQTKAQAKASVGKSGITTIYESSWTESKNLVLALKKIGYRLVDVDPEYQIEGRHGRPGYKFVDVDPSYSIEGTYPRSLGPNMAALIVWDIIMGIPSLVLPVPIMGNYTWTVDINISDGTTGEVLSKINEKLDYRVKGLWLWGFIKTRIVNQEDILGIISKRIDEEITRLELKKHGES